MAIMVKTKAVIGEADNGAEFADEHNPVPKWNDVLREEEAFARELEHSK